MKLFYLAKFRKMLLMFEIGVACKIVTEQISPKRTLLHYHVIGDSTYMIHSTVSSRVLKAIGDVEGFQVVVCLFC